VWIKTAWRHISTEVTVKGFKKCCAKDGTDVGMLWNGTKKDGKVSNGETN